MTKQNMPRLTESQLFTIEALNGIQGFVWPKEATHASMDAETQVVDFWTAEPRPLQTPSAFDGPDDSLVDNDVYAKSKHPDWRGSLITREQFDSVDGSVRRPIMKSNPWHPSFCPITGRKFFMWIEHPTIGMVPTFGGPYDSYTLPERDDDGSYSVHRFDHDEGAWVDDECVSFIVVSDDLPASKAELDAELQPYIDIIIRMVGLLSSSGVKASQNSQNPAEVWLHDALNLIDNKQPSIPTLTNEQCLKFLCTAFRHNEIKGDIEFDDINLGLRMALSREAN